MSYVYAVNFTVDFRQAVQTHTQTFLGLDKCQALGRGGQGGIVTQEPLQVPFNDFRLGLMLFHGIELSAFTRLTQRGIESGIFFADILKSFHHKLRQPYHIVGQGTQGGGIEFHGFVVGSEGFVNQFGGTVEDTAEGIGRKDIVQVGQILDAKQMAEEVFHGAVQILFKSRNREVQRTRFHQSASIFFADFLGQIVGHTTLEVQLGEAYGYPGFDKDAQHEA